MAVFRTREAAEAFVDDDPFVKNGVVASFENQGLERDAARLRSHAAAPATAPQAGFRSCMASRAAIMPPRARAGGSAPATAS